MCSFRPRSNRITSSSSSATASPAVSLLSSSISTDSCTAADRRACMLSFSKSSEPVPRKSPSSSSSSSSCLDPADEGLFCCILGILTLAVPAEKGLGFFSVSDLIVVCVASCSFDSTRLSRGKPGSDGGRRSWYIPPPAPAPSESRDESCASSTRCFCFSASSLSASVSIIPGTPSTTGAGDTVMWTDGNSCLGMERSGCWGGGGCSRVC
mmetsp:Transcript_35977/g.112508  ORF Transcript_35977/g.112508 Transcript_35977/m.112508 type:complete len:210 (-) Transcript_35977:795-1424(-)